MTADLSRLQIFGPIVKFNDTVICQFRFICTERWDNLMPIPGVSNKRFCAVCKSPVYMTSNYEELEANISAKRCVVILVERPEGPQLELMGDVLLAIPGSEASIARILTRPIVELELSEETAKALEANSVQLIGDLTQCTQDQLISEFEITESQLGEIIEVLAYRGLTIDVKTDDWALSSAKYR